MRRLLSRLALPTTLALLVAGCGASGGGASATTVTPDSAKPVTIKVGETAGVPAAFLEYGEQKGMFKAQGLHLQVTAAAGGAAIIPAVVSGGYQFGGSNTTSVLLARSRGLPISMVAPGTFATDKPDADFSAVLVDKGSPIASARDLAGKTIAVNTLKNVGDITIRAALRARGVDTSGIRFVEVGFPDMLAAVSGGRVDAAWEIEPFVSQGRGQGFRPVLWPYVESKPGLEVGSYVASTKYVQQQPKVVAAFRKGVAATAKAIAADPASFRSALPELQKISAQDAQTMILPAWQGTVDMDSLRFMADAMRSYGMVDKDIDVASAVASGAAG